MSGNPTQPNIPLLNTPFLDPNGFLNFPWYEVISALYRKTGGSSPSSSSATLQVDGEGTLVAFDVSGNEIGPISYADTAAQPEVQLAPAASPYLYKATQSGFLIIEPGTSAAVSISRNGLTFYPVLTNGGQLVMIVGDQALITWSGSFPIVYWFAGNTGAVS